MLVMCFKLVDPYRYIITTTDHGKVCLHTYCVYPTCIQNKRTCVHKIAWLRAIESETNGISARGQNSEADVETFISSKLLIRSIIN